MTSSLYVAYAAMRADMQALDVAANNLANVNTNGFREERPFIEALERAGWSYPEVGGTRAKTEPGPLAATGRDLDVAIDGPGFLVVATPGGRRYTRDGGLSLDEDRVLVTRQGAPVLGQGGPLELGRGKVEIDPEGRVTADGNQQGRLLLVRVDERALVREAGGLYRLAEGRESPDTASRLRQGFLEKSNVELPSGDVGQLRRHFQSLSRAIQVANGLDQRLIRTARGE